MFERLKFMYRFYKSYRTSRREGLAHEEAKSAAIEKIIDAELGEHTFANAMAHEPLDVPDSVSTYWQDPSAAFYEAHEDDDDAWFGGGKFEVTAAHIALMRQMKFAWDGAERGAPMLDPEQPYGHTDVLAQLAKVFGTEDADALARHHVDVTFALARTLEHGTLVPGQYPLRNIDGGRVRELMEGYGETGRLPDDDLGLLADDMIAVTDEHIKLLQHIDVRWPPESDCEERIEDGQYPAAACDPKRPYGDMTFIELDMARILDRLSEPPPRSENDPLPVFEPEPALAQHLQQLHWQMLVAIQVFVENAEIEPGIYE